MQSSTTDERDTPTTGAGGNTPPSRGSLRHGAALVGAFAKIAAVGVLAGTCMYGIDRLRAAVTGEVLRLSF